jgi:signal transduction histidine kinase
MKNMLSRADTLGTVLSAEFADDFEDKNFAYLKDALNIYSRLPFIEFISVADNNNFVYYSSKKERESKQNLQKDSISIKDEKGDCFIKSFPMTYNGRQNGLVQIGFSYKEMKTDMARVIKWSIGFNLIALILILSVAWYVSGRLMSPLKTMQDAADTIAAGDFSPRLDVTTDDVIGGLALSLNNMAERLNDLTANLNKKIDEATAELKEKTRALEDTNKKLLELDKMKSDFVSIVSHELRTPLTGIIGFAQTMLRLNLSDEQKKTYLNIIVTEGNRLALLIEDFLDIAKIEAGSFDLRLGPVFLPKLVAETLDSINAPANLKIITEFDRDFPEISGDKDRLKQVVVNLFGNAIKYSPDGGEIFVEGKVNPDSVVVSVKDNGPGLSDTEKRKVFNRFYRGNDDIARKNRGSGLGLPIAKAIIESHNGKIWVESERGQGSRFTFLLPRDKGDKNG